MEHMQLTSKEKPSLSRLHFQGYNCRDYLYFVTLHGADGPKRRVMEKEI